MVKSKFSKGKVIHKTRKTAEAIASQAKYIGVPTRIRKLKDGYRVDKNWN